MGFLSRSVDKDRPCYAAPPFLAGARREQKQTARLPSLAAGRLVR